MKNIFAILLALTGLTAVAAPTFQPLPGTPEYAALIAGGSNPPVVISNPPAPVVVKPAVAPVVEKPIAKAAPAAVTNPPAAPLASVPSRKKKSAATSTSVSELVPVSKPLMDTTKLSTNSTVAAPAAPLPVAVVSTNPAELKNGVLTVSVPASAAPTPVAPPAVPPAVEPVAVAEPPASAPVASTAPAAITPPAAPRALPRRGAAAAAVPPAPGVPGTSTPVITPPMTMPPSKTAATASSDLIPAGMIRFQAAPLEQVLDFYSEMVGRTLLRPAQLPAASITIKTQTELTKEEAIQALDAVLGLNQITMIPVGKKFVKVVPVAQANQEAAPIDTNDVENLPDIGQYVTHVVQLKYAKPSELMTTLTPFQKIQGSITPIDSNGILILRDYTENVKRMLELINQIDVAVPSEFVSEVIPIKYALAADIASALNSVGGGSSTAIGGGTTTAGTAGATGRAAGTTTGFGGGLRTAGAQTVGGSTGFGGNRTGGYGGANGVGGTGNVANGGNGGQPQTFAQRLQNIMRSAGAGAAGEIQLIGPNKIIPDERTNSLLVFATRQDMDTIKDIVAKLDVVLQQVLIEAIILDVTLADNFDFGVSAGQQPVTSGAVTGGGVANNGNGSVNTGLAFLNNLLQQTTNILSGTNIIGTNTFFVKNPNANAFPTTDGLNYFGKIGPTWNVALNALAGKNNIKVLARPSIQTSHAVPAQIFVGETRPYITGTTYNSINGGNQSSYQQSQIGISLNVTPLINPDGLVVMDIQQQVQQVGGSVKIDNNDVPITQDQNASAKVAVRNGETIVMGGFIQNQKSEGKSGIPYLQDIPLLGALFRSTTTTSNRRELLVLIRPTVLPTPEAAALETAVQRDRLPNARAAQDEFEKEDAKLLKRAKMRAKMPAKDDEK